MQIAIEIDSYVLEHCKRRVKEHYANNIEEAIANGIPLPKGHGDLVDRDAINDRFYNIWKELESYSNKPTYKKLLDRWSMCMDTAPAIIKADGGSEDES